MLCNWIRSGSFMFNVHQCHFMLLTFSSNLIMNGGMNSFPNFLWCSKNCNSIYHKMNLYLIEGVMLKYEKSFWEFFSYQGTFVNIFCLKFKLVSNTLVIRFVFFFKLLDNFNLFLLTWGFQNQECNKRIIKDTLWR